VFPGVLHSSRGLSFSRADVPNFRHTCCETRFGFASSAFHAELPRTVRFNFGNYYVSRERGSTLASYLFLNIKSRFPIRSLSLFLSIFLSFFPFDLAIEINRDRWTDRSRRFLLFLSRDSSLPLPSPPRGAGIKFTRE